MMESTISIQQALLEQVETLAQRLNLTPQDVVERALTQFLREQHEPTSATTQRLIHQGDVYWLHPAPDAGIAHPHVVVQEDVLNHSRITTVVVCAVTSNAKKASVPGSVLLEAGEANLSRPSIVEVSKVWTVEKTQLGAYIGTLSAARVQQIFDGMRFLQTSFFAR